MKHILEKHLHQKINEIKYNGKYTEFTIKINNNDYVISFNTDSGNEYIFNFFYDEEDSLSPYKNNTLFHIGFTLKTQYNNTDYENKTNLKEQIELMSRMIYIFCQVHTEIISLKYLDVIYVIGETEDKKLNYYRDAIKNSFDNVSELKGKSSEYEEKDAYYYKIN